MLEVRAIAGWATAAMISIVVFSLAYLVSAFVPLIEVWAADRVASSGGGGPAAIALLARVAISIVLIGAFLTAAVCFVVWLARARANLMVFPDARPRLGTGFAVGVWFLPLANLIGPPVVVGEVVAASAPAGKGRTAALVWTWWTLFLLAWIALLAGVSTTAGDLDTLGLVRERLADGETVSESQAGRVFGSEILARLPAAALFVAAATAALVLIARTTCGQYHRVELLRGQARGPEPVTGATI